MEFIWIDGGFQPSKFIEGWLYSRGGVSPTFIYVLLSGMKIGTKRYKNSIFHWFL